MDVGTISSEDLMASYRRQLSEAHEKIALLEAALMRDQRAEGQRNKIEKLMQENSGEEG
jgi:hypothetical protein